MDPLVGLLFVSVTLLVLLVALVIGRKLRRDAAEVSGRGRRARLAQTLLGGDDPALHRLARETRNRLAAQRDLALACTSIDRLPPARLDHVHGVLKPLADALADRLDARDPVTRGQAAIVLARLRAPHADMLIAPLLRDRDADVRLAVAGSLAWLGSDAAAEALLDALRERALPPERLVERLGAAWAVLPVIEELHRALDQPSRSTTREWLARALGLAGDRRAEAPLIELLCVGAQEERISAARALGACGGPASLEPLARALVDDAWTVRGQAAAALGRLGAGEAVPALAGLLGDPAWWVRARAAEALAELGQRGRAALERAAAEHSDPFARDRAREALGFVGQIEARAA